MIKFYNFLDKIKKQVLEEDLILEEDLNKFLTIIYYSFKIQDEILLKKILEILELINENRQMKINSKKEFDFYHFNQIFLDKQTKRFFENKRNFLY